MAVKRTPSGRTPNFEPGTAWLSGLIVTTLSTGVVIMSASVAAAVLIAFGMAFALAAALGFFR
ncbi:hypothetical protein OG225_13310 [Nocardia sp. NBC_01377]|uniref:hypothetical protein n=1 Tax=Nocardia sp. NBC_01377 TaxID=2903595 RepID=UPI00324F1E1C